MRLFLVVLLATAVALGGCGGDDDSESSTGADAAATTAETAPSGVTETTPAETETEAEQQGSDDDTAAGGGGSDDSGGASDDSGGGSDDSGGTSASGGGGSGGGGSSGSGEDRQAVSSTVTDFYAALSSGDGGKACDLMDEAVKAQFTKALAQAQNKQGASCETLAGSIADAYPAQLRDRLGKLRVVKVTIKGDTATVTAKIPDTPASTLPLVRDGDSWKIQAPVGAGSP